MPSSCPDWAGCASLRLKERGYLPVTETAGVKIRSATVSEHAGHWYVSVQVEQECAVPTNIGPIVGVDLGQDARHPRGRDRDS